jgi:hypothetical protein
LCSLAYSATGSLSQSEDLAQETFVTAWKQLAGSHYYLQPRCGSGLCRIRRISSLETQTQFIILKKS